MRVSPGNRCSFRSMCMGLCILNMVVANGCGLEYIVNDRETGLPSNLVVTGWTNDGCIENLYDTAEKLEFKINLIEVTREYEGFGAIPMPSPFWPMYTCEGQIIPFAKP